MSTDWHLAQFNVAKMRYQADDPRMADFVNNLDRLNQLGDQSAGWVWRHAEESGTTTMGTFDGADVAINFTIWEDVESLHQYTYRTEHKDFLRRRREWFEPMPDWPIVVMWWIPAGTIPSLDEATAKLAELRDHGPTASAFTFRDRFQKPA